MTYVEAIWKKKLFSFVPWNFGGHNLESVFSWEQRQQNGKYSQEMEKGQFLVILFEHLET